MEVVLVASFRATGHRGEGVNDSCAVPIVRLSGCRVFDSPLGADPEIVLRDCIFFEVISLCGADVV